MPQKKILILTANPDDDKKIRTDKEIKAIKEKLDQSKNQDKFEIIFELAVNPDDLIPILQKQEPEVVHFCGHGKREGLVFENEAGKAQTVKAEALAGLLEKFKDKVKCVLLNACYTDIQAREINNHIQYVIGMKEQIEDTAAIKFATNFYATLIAGRSYRDAYDFGCIALDLLGIKGDLLPVFLEKPQPIIPRQLAQPSPSHYNDVINGFKNGNVIPFLGPGINLYDGQQSKQRISDIELADYFKQDQGINNPYQDLVGTPCSVCLVSSDELPPDCPIKKALLAGTNVACPLANEQALAVAKLYLQYLAQNIESTCGGIESVYKKFGEFLKGPYSPNKLHKFFAKLPKTMGAKDYHLPYQLLVTTNYDDMLERAFKEANQPFDLVFYEAEGDETGGRFQHHPYEESKYPITNSDNRVLPSDRPVILKLYGAVNNFVITEEHHINYLVHQEIDRLLPKDILEILWKHNILLMGYSPNDANLRLIVNRLWGKKDLGKASWLIHQSKQLGKLDNEFWQNRKVNLLDSDLEDYRTGLDKAIEALECKKSPYRQWS